MGSSVSRVWIPRQEEEGQSWAAPFERAGLRLKFRPWQFYVSLPSSRLNKSFPTGYRALVVSSPRALQFLYSEEPWKQLPAFGLGPGTEKALIEAGFEVLGVAQGNAQSLADLLIKETPPQSHFLFPCNHKAGSLLRDELVKSGRSLERYEVYDARPIPITAQENKDINEPGQAAVLMSSQQAHIFATTIRMECRPVFPVVAIGKSTACTLRELGFEKLVVAPSPEPEPLAKAALAAWLSPKENSE